LPAQAKDAQRHKIRAQTILAAQVPQSSLWAAHQVMGALPGIINGGKKNFFVGKIKNVNTINRLMDFATDTLTFTVLSDILAVSVWVLLKGQGWRFGL
jgi:hypothetical protein